MDSTSVDLRSLLDRLKEAQHALIEDVARQPGVPSTAIIRRIAELENTIAAVFGLHRGAPGRLRIRLPWRPTAMGQKGRSFRTAEADEIAGPRKPCRIHADRENATQHLRDRTFFLTNAARQAGLAPSFSKPPFFRRAFCFCSESASFHSGSWGERLLKRRIAGNAPLTRSCQPGLVSALALRRTRVVPSSSRGTREELSFFRRSLVVPTATSRLGQAALS
jgi:hypothetical protein